MLPESGKASAFAPYRLTVRVARVSVDPYHTPQTVRALKSFSCFVVYAVSRLAIGPPHIHPRSSELFHVLKGSFLTGFLEENGGRYIENNVTTGQITVFPQGLVHFVQNLDCINATFLSVFGSEDPGTLTVSTRLFNINQQALTSTFNQPEIVIDLIKVNIPNPPAPGVGECRKRCNLPPLN